MGSQAEANLAALIESTSDLIWSVDLDFRLIVFNRALGENFERNFGVHIVPGMAARDFLPTERAEVWPDFYRRALAEGAFRTEFSLADGRTLELSLNPILLDGKATGVSVFGEDITERKVAEKAIREAERCYHSIFDRALEGIFQTTLGGGPLTANPALAHILGYDSVDDFLHSVHDMGRQVWENQQERIEAVRHIQQNGSIQCLECRFKRKDGTPIWVSLHAHRALSADGVASIIEGFMEDITERKQTVKLLAESEQIFRAMTDASPLAVIMATADERNVYLNPTFTQLFGYTAEEVPTLAAWLPLAYPDPKYRVWALAEWHRRTEKAIATRGKIDPMEVEVVCKDGSKKQVSWGFISLGEVNMLIGIDLTERKHVEMQLRESEAAYRATFEQAAIGIVHNTFDGVYLRCNPAFAKIIGYPIEEVPGLKIMQVTSPEDQEKTAEVLQQLVDGAQETIHWEKRYMRKDGSLIWVRMSTSVRCDTDGHPLYGMSLVEDIQARKEAEERLAEATEALRISENRYHTAFKTSLDAIAISRLDDGMIVDVSNNYLEVMGFSREELVEQIREVPNTWVDMDGEVHHNTFFEVRGITSGEMNIWVDPNDRKRWVEMLRRDSVCRNFETRFRRKDGRMIWVLTSASVTEMDGVPCVLSIIRDITETKAAAEALQTSEARYRTVFHTAFDPITISQLDDGIFIDTNQAFLDLYGYENQEVLGRSVLELDLWVDRSDRERLLDELRQHPRCRDMEARFRKKNGDIVYGLLSASVIEIKGMPCILSVTRDITATKAAEEKIQSLSYYDTLTNLPNRRLLMERLKKALAAAGSSQTKKALLFVDLDHFKTLNDTLGHPVGDLLLQEVGRRLRACLHDDDTVARIGSDEFVVLIENLSEVAEVAAAQTGAIGERMLDEIQQPYTFGPIDCRCTASIGIVVFGDQSGGPSDLLQQADIAMGQAKTAKRNTLRFFAPDLQAAVNARVALEEDLRQAIATRQFLLYYQPQIEDTRLLGAEALIRWKHPVRGMISPGAFIPLAEETGMIVALGDWVLEEACRQVAAWTANKQMDRVSIAINVSARQFHQPDFVDKVVSTLQRTGANPHNIELELTEGLLVENVEDVIAKMIVLKECGLRFSLDDFGTGYSSLSYLKRLPLDQLKIDISFVRDILVDAGSATIAQTIVALGHAMGLAVIAEGVETEEQRTLLSSLGCHAYQGYLFSKPLPREEFERLLSALSADAS